MSEEIYEVSVKTRARRRKVEQIGANTLKISTPIVPEKGKANEDIVDILAAHFHVPKSAVDILRGKTSSKKRVRIIR